MLRWLDFIGTLGCSKTEHIFVLLSQKINELPVVDKDVLGDRIYYSFLQSGVLFLLENDRVNQISFFIKSVESFAKYEGELPIDVELNNNETSIINILGLPSLSGGGKSDMLFGYINRWIKYDKGQYELHFEFDKTDLLCKVSLMIKE
ncbi:hypothetical protein GEA64_23240 [Photorhabdus khanii]|uniref:Uncharacterized protein n=1 Tax=Photorhabdus khanii TaxID=1004150 RepID=A0A7C9KUN7_9GAMM|nr:hypothetical protein [Photorhabdus khanii]MQL50686.1 hypothetical protein [Photorhabdus khanii]